MLGISCFSWVLFLSLHLLSPFSFSLLLLLLLLLCFTSFQLLTYSYLNPWVDHSLQDGVESHQRDRTRCPAPGREHRRNWSFQPNARTVLRLLGQCWGCWDHAGGSAPWAGDSCGWAWRCHCLVPLCMEAPAQPGSMTQDVQGVSTVWEEQSLAQCPSPLQEGDFWQREKHSTALAVANAGQWQLEEPRGWCLAATRAIQRLYMHGCS